MTVMFEHTVGQWGSATRPNGHFDTIDSETSKSTEQVQSPLEVIHTSADRCDRCIETITFICKASRRPALNAEINGPAHE